MCLYFILLFLLIKYISIPGWIQSTFINCKAIFYIKIYILFHFYAHQLCNIQSTHIWELEKYFKMINGKYSIFSILILYNSQQYEQQ